MVYANGMFICAINPIEPAILIMAGNKNIQSMEDSCLPGLRMNGIEYPISNKECPIMKSKSVPTRVQFQCCKGVAISFAIQ
jgi:hypothetical protein